MLQRLAMTLESSLLQVNQVSIKNRACISIPNFLAGATMEPVSWQEMRCPKTGKIEKRKCAKPEGL